MLAVLQAAWLIGGCGLRTVISPEADVGDQTADGGGAPAANAATNPCGFGVPPCNPKDFGGRTCESVGQGAGDLACDPNTCNLVLTGCGPALDAGINNGQTGMTGTGGDPGTIPGFFGGGTGGDGAFPGFPGANFFGGGAGGANAFPGFFGGTPPADEDGGTAGGNPGFPGFFGGAFFGGGNNGNGGN
jgi:hypothetical protein